MNGFRLKMAARKFLRHTLLTWPLLVCLPLVPVHAEDVIHAGNDAEVARKEAELEQLKQRILALQESLARDEQRLASEDSALRDIDLQIDAINARLRVLEQDKRNIEQEMEVLLRQRQQELAALAAEQQVLGEHLRAAYISGNEEYFKLLLNLQDPAAISRMLVYYRFLARDRVQTIERINVHLDELQRLSADIASRQRALDATIAEQRQRWEGLQAAYQQQQAAVDRLQASIADSAQQVTRMKSDEATLLGLIERLQTVLDELLEEEKRGVVFRDQRGRLSLPLQARIAAAYGSPRNIGNLRWNGIMLRAAEGSPVRAVFTGRVVYAEWMRGFGLLLIIDHGDGYMSLYGHNESLLVEEGDWVETGQPVATVGMSGGGNRPGLYFEIRHRGKPQDPLRWCRRSPA